MFFLNNNFVFFLAISLPILLSFPTQADPPGQDRKDTQIVEYRLVGVTSVLTDGSIETTTDDNVFIRGRHAANVLCRSDYGPQARAGTTEDLVRTPGPDALFEESSWIQPINVIVLEAFGGYIGRDANSNPSGLILDNNQFDAYNNTSCSLWNSSNPDHRGYMLRSNKVSLLYSDCDSIMKISCAAPVVIP